MKSLYAFTIVILIYLIYSNNIFANDSTKMAQKKVIEIGFTNSIKAPDLIIKRLTAAAIDDSIKFTLFYSTQKDRFLSFFNPPSGNNLKYFKRDALKANDTAVSFFIRKDQLKLQDHISMRFSAHNNRIFESDRNFIFLDMNDIRGKVLKMKTAFILSYYQHNKNITTFKEFQDVRWDNLTPVEDSLNYHKIATLIFNKNSNFGKHSNEAEQILDKGKNPGLGVKLLHKQGITGKGVKIAVISQNLPGNHPEYKDRIQKYKDFGCKQPKTKGSMMGPAILSALAGTNTGTAPEIKVFYAAVPSWKNDGKYEADALKWIIKENKKLAKENKIRIVVTGEGTTFQKNNNLWDEVLKTAEKEGIIVLTSTKDKGFIGPCYYDLYNPEDVSKCKFGWPDQTDTLKKMFKKIYAPCSRRTLAEEYKMDENSYQYYGKMANAWSIPYVAGVMAMGWQIKPDINGEQMIQYLINTAYSNQEGYSIIDPVNFIKYLQQLK